VKVLYASRIEKDIPGYEGLYQINPQGQIRSIKRQGSKGLIKKTPLSHKGYCGIRLHKDGVGRSYIVHRLIAQAFIPNPYNLPQVNHKDGNKTNNHVNNLEWVDQSGNMKHAYSNGLKVAPSGIKNGRAKLTEVQVINIRHCKGAATHRELANIFGVSKYLIHAIHARKLWTNI